MDDLRDGSTMRIGNITFDCADPDRMASFWAAALGYEKREYPEEMRRQLLEAGLSEDDLATRGLAEDPGGAGPRLLFLKVPEGKFREPRTERSALTWRNIS